MRFCLLLLRVILPPTLSLHTAVLMGEVPNKQRCRQGWTVYPTLHQPFFFRDLSCEEGGGVTDCTQVKPHQETITGTASTIPITVIKGIVDNLAVCFMVFPRVFLCLLLVFVLSCGQNTVILSIYSQKWHHFSISRAFFACSASAITRLFVTFPTACGVSCH